MHSNSVHTDVHSLCLVTEHLHRWYTFIDGTPSYMVHLHRWYTRSAALPVCPYFLAHSIFTTLSFGLNASDSFISLAHPFYFLLFFKRMHSASRCQDPVGTLGWSRLLPPCGACPFPWFPCPGSTGPSRGLMLKSCWTGTRMDSSS